MTLSLPVEARGNVSRQALDKADVIPAVVYGPKQEAVSLRIARADFERVFKISGESTIIVLEGLDEPIDVLVHSVDFHPSRGGIVHVDFYAFERGKEMTTDIPLTYTGEAPVEKTGGMVSHVLHEVTVTCRPSNLPKEIMVDVSSLDTEGSYLTIADLVMPEGVTIEHEPTETVAVAQGEREEDPEEAPEAVDMESVEVEEKGKGEEEVEDKDS